MSALLMLSGSQRRESWNSRLLEHLAASLQWQCDVDVLDSRAIGLPLFDQDMETDLALLETLASLHQRFAECSGIIVACPEYNGQATPLLKNTIDWVSRLAHIDGRFDNPFIDKPVLLCSASTGSSAGALAIQNLRALFGYVGSAVLGHSIGIAHAPQQWSADGFRFDDATESRIDAALASLLHWATKTGQVTGPEVLAVQNHVGLNGTPANN
jgi:NAD(P)H-dependent FMN reductase